MREKLKKMLYAFAALIVSVSCCPLVALAAEEAEEYVPSMYASFWALVPPIVAIALALITKEVYSSLFIGILVGGLFYSGFRFEGTIQQWPMLNTVPTNCINMLFLFIKY